MEPLEAIRFVLANINAGGDAVYRSQVLAIIEDFIIKDDSPRWDADELQQFIFNIDD